MRCSRCGFENAAGIRFCGECGAALTARCSACGFENQPGIKFCGGCGQRLAGLAERAPTRGSDTPKHLAEKILSSRSALEGERKQVTVLFADVKGSMDLGERVDPEEWYRIMDRFFQILSEGVHRFEGTVDKFTGDGIMAIFGAPIAHEDHARRGCYAALHLQEELRRYADELRLTRALNFAVRMGLNSGEVVVGTIGDDLKMVYTAHGNTVGLANRMEQIAEPGKIYLTEHTAKLVSGFVELRDLGRLELKGSTEPVHVHELQGVGRLKTKLEVSRARGFSKFIGREREMDALEAALEQAIAGNAQVIGVVAEAGTGKSRLCFEFLERCRARGVAVYKAHCVAHGKAVPLLPVLEFFRNYFGITDHDPPRTARDKAAGRMLLLDPTLAEGLPLMLDFLGVPDPDLSPPPVDPEARQQRLFDVIRRLARARSAREPAILFFEDLHWLDQASEGFIRQIVEIASSSRTLVLVNFRPEYHAAWMQRSYYHQLPLLPLGPEQAAELLADLLGADPSLERVRALIQERTAGNPFFIEEIVRSLVEAGTFAGSSGAYRLVTSAAELRLPSTVQSVLAARIDRLEDHDKHVLQTASVIGRSFSEPVLRRVTNVAADDLTAALAALTDAEFLYEEALYPDVAYAFKHPLTQEVAYGSQLAERRARVHAAVARAIEELDRGKLDEQAAILAGHWQRAGDAREAAKWHRRAAEWVGGNDLNEGFRHWTRARELLDALPETPENLAERAAIRANMVFLLGRFGDSEERANALFSEGRRFAERSADVRVQALLLNNFGLLRLNSGAASEALGLLLDARRLADEAKDPGLRANVRYALCGAYWVAARPADCISVTEEGLVIARDNLGLEGTLLGTSPHLMLSTMHAAALNWTGRFGDADEELDRIIDEARVTRQPVPRHLAHIHQVIRCELIGDHRAALLHAREAMRDVEGDSNTLLQLWAYSVWGVANVVNGEWQVARGALDHALRVSRERSLRGPECLSLATMARVHLGLGDAAMARLKAEEAIALGRRFGMRAFEIYALLARARAFRELGEPKSEIEAVIAEAADWVKSTGSAGFAPFVHVERAELHRLEGKQEARERELREAHRLFTNMGAFGHADRVATELAS